MSSRQQQVSRAKESTFKHDEQLLGKSSQIILQVISLAGDVFHFVGQGPLVLLQTSRLLVGFIKGSLQLDVLFLQFTD